MREEKMLMRILNQQSEKEHFHRDIELLYVLEGAVNLLVENQHTRLAPGDVILINSEKAHSLRNSDDVLYMKLSFQYSLVSDILSDYDLLFWCDSTRNNDETYATLRRMLQRLISNYVNKNGDTQNYAHIAMCYQILDFLCSNFLLREASSQPADNKADQRVDIINSYIRANYDKPINLRDLAEKMYLSNGYLSRFFKSNFGMGFGDYVTRVRLFHAIDDLLYTEDPVTQIAFSNGFASVAAFNKAFKKEYGETPSAVRKRAQSKQHKAEEVASVIGDARLEKYAWADNDAQLDMVGSGEKSVLLDVSEYKPLTPIWNQVINVGSAEDLMRSEVRHHVEKLKELLGFTYARIWAPFTRGMFIDINQTTGRYNFSRLDSILDFLVSIDVVPFIDLMPKPQRLMSTTTENIMTLEREMPHDEGAWEHLMMAFMHHVRHRYRSAEVSKWKFEMWFDESELGFEEAVKGYANLCVSSWKAIQKYSPESEFGGFGLHLHTSMEFAGYADIRHFFEVLNERYKAEGATIDFISVYAYGYEEVGTKEDSQRLRQMSLSYLGDAFKTVKRELRQWGLGSVKVYVTEWNLTVSDRNYINDTCFKGAYAIKSYIDFYGHTDIAAYFMGSDRIAEYADSDGVLFGGLGLLSKDGIMKPAAFAHELLNMLYPNFVCKGENYLATTNGRGAYRIVCHNCKQLSYRYFDTNENELDLRSLGRYYADADPLRLTFTLSGVGDGEYLMKIHTISEKNGSLLNMWEEMDFERDLSHNDIRYLRDACSGKMTMHGVTAKGGTLTVDVPLPANAFALVKLRRRA